MHSRGDLTLAPEATGVCVPVTLFFVCLGSSPSRWLHCIRWRKHHGQDQTTATQGPAQGHPPAPGAQVTLSPHLRWPLVLGPEGAVTDGWVAIQ